MPSSVNIPAIALPWCCPTASQKARSMLVTFMALLPASSLPDLRHRRDDARDILRARQAVIAVLDHGQHHILGRQAMRQRKGGLPGHIGILRTLQDPNRTSDLDGAAEQQMIASLFDQRTRDRIRRAVALLRPPP